MPAEPPGPPSQPPTPSRSRPIHISAKPIDPGVDTGDGLPRTEWHAAVRLRERYGLEITRESIIKLSRDIAGLMPVKTKGQPQAKGTGLARPPSTRDLMYVGHRRPRGELWMVRLNSYIYSYQYNHNACHVGRGESAGVGAGAIWAYAVFDRGSEKVVTFLEGSRAKIN